MTNRISCFTCQSCHCFCATNSQSHGLGLFQISTQRSQQRHLSRLTSQDVAFFQMSFGCLVSLVTSSGEVEKNTGKLSKVRVLLTRPACSSPAKPERMLKSKLQANNVRRIEKLFDFKQKQVLRPGSVLGQQSATAAWGKVTQLYLTSIKFLMVFDFLIGSDSASLSLSLSIW